MSFKFSLIAILITISVPILNIDFIPLEMEVVIFKVFLGITWDYTP